MVFLLTDFPADISYIINSGQNHWLEDRHPSSFQVIRTKLGKKIDKYLIIRGSVYFIDQQHNLFVWLSAEFGQRSKQRRQCRPVWMARGILLQFRLHFCRNMGCVFQQFPRKSSNEIQLGCKISITDRLKIQTDYLIFFFQKSGKRCQYRCFSILSGSVDRKILSGIHHRSDFVQAAGQIDHIVQFRITVSIGIKNFAHVPSFLSLHTLMHPVPLLYPSIRSGGFQGSIRADSINGSKVLQMCRTQRSIDRNCPAPRFFHVPSPISHHTFSKIPA